jgi:hypothetical protein
MLHMLSERSGQSGATHWLDYQMDVPAERKKIPTIVLVGAGGRTNLHSEHATADDLLGAVILFEYRIAGRGIRVFAADDATGQRAVIAPQHLRAQIAEAACNGLLSQGALAVILTYEGRMEPSSQQKRRNLPNGNRVDSATRTRSVPLYLPLAATFEATLASLGRHTRRNLRYYRRRTESELAASFVPRAAISRSEFLEINRTSINPAPNAIAQWRYDSFAGMPEMLFAGMRSRDGRWLSLIGGRRHHKVTEIDWQMNLAGLPRLSLSTVMRSYLLEHEVQLGTEILKFTGGTPHSMRHSFVSADVVDALFLRQSSGSRMLRTLAPVLLPKNNFLAQALCDPAMRWATG